MRKHFHYMLAAMLSAVLVMTSGTQAMASSLTETEPVVDTITLDSDLVWDEDIPADLSWKTKQDKGQWINDLGISEDVSSLILVINNLDKEDPDALPKQVAETATDASASRTTSKKTAKEVDLTGKSRLSYFSRDLDGVWHEFFSADCFIAGDAMNGKEVVYGVYVPHSTFGVKENPGSLLPYTFLTPLDYWITNPDDENFGEIYTASSRNDRPIDGIKLENLKTFCNYGMIVQAESEDSGYPALVLNCQQSDTNDGTFCGIQIPESYMRILVQSLDEKTRIVITDDLSSLDSMIGSEGETEDENEK